VTTFPGAEAATWAEAIATLVKDGRIRVIRLREIDGEPASTHPATSALLAAGFADGYHGPTHRG
jgi:hypothetical protein